MPVAPLSVQIVLTFIQGLAVCSLYSGRDVRDGHRAGTFSCGVLWLLKKQGVMEIFCFVRQYHEKMDTNFEYDLFVDVIKRLHLNYLL